ncbi:Protein CNPPD1-like [Oopsacas minuta]|uniref:Protein CNPPD1 n=1 Tax=Oopsacas minuta TaxID=111878 RepID=A0AAV7JUF0_9METZ|nr:Protein CNPPD1-like [Oopsacas minuta]
MESEYLGLGWISRKKTIQFPSYGEEFDNYLDEYSFEEASIYLNSFTINQMASLTSTPPSRRLLDSTSTICRRAMISPYCMILGLAYAKEYHKKCSHNLSITKLNTFDLFLVSMILSNKFLIDNGEYEAISNKEWANLSKKTVSEVNNLETMFLNAIEWKLYMSQKEFNEFSKEIEAQIVTDLVKRRGYCTYREILTLFRWRDFNAKFQTSVRNMGIAFLSSFAFYLTGVLALSVAVKGLKVMSQPSNVDQITQVQAHNSIEAKDNVLMKINSPNIRLQIIAPKTDPELSELIQSNLTDVNTPVVYEYSICNAACIQYISPLNLAVSPPYASLNNWHTLST